MVVVIVFCIFVKQLFELYLTPDVVGAVPRRESDVFVKAGVKSESEAIIQ